RLERRLPACHARGPPDSRRDDLDLGQLRPARGGHLGWVQAEWHGARARLPRAERLRRDQADLHRWHRSRDEAAVWSGDQGLAMPSLSRQLARWVAGLRYDDLPPAVVDRAKGVTLQGLASALIGSQTPDGRQAVALITEEEAGVTQGATILVSGTRATKGGAAFANSEMVFAGGKWDTFRMLTHPGTSIIPCALIAAETSGASGKDFITGLAAGYEVAERMAADVIPTVMARGFHAGPVFGIF